jgi:DNA-binding LacI/PurR family transcriptional regulator
VLYSMIGGERPPERDIVLATELVRRESCGCPAGTGNDGEVWL